MSKISEIKRRKGFSLLELLLVLGIIAALIVAAFIVYPKVRTSQIVDAESKNIATIRGGLLSLYSATTDITTVNNTVGINAQIFPDNMLVKSGSSVVDVVNGFKGKVTLSATNYASYGKVVFNIGYANVPSRCLRKTCCCSCSKYVNNQYWRKHSEKRYIEYRLEYSECCYSM